MLRGATLRRRLWKPERALEPYREYQRRGRVKFADWGQNNRKEDKGKLRI